MWTCSNCPATREKPEKRLPSGWKKRGEEESAEIFCDECWGKLYMLRAITLPVVSPVDVTWDQFNAALRLMWQATTQASNWIVTELFARDVKRSPGEAKMPPMPPTYLYPEIRQRWPVLPSSTAASLERAVQAKYRAMRYKVGWTYQQSLPTFRYPTPFPVPAQAWSIGMEQDVPLLSVRIGDTRLLLRLHGGWRYKRQRAAIQQMAAGTATTGEMALYRNGDEIMAKLVAWLPRAGDKRLRSGILRVRTSADSLMVAVNDKDEKLWTYNADHLKRWIVKHRWMLQRLSEDAKYEQRPVAKFAQRRYDYVKKFAHRMDSACHEIAAQLANYADRRRFASVVYDDSERGFVPSFPYLRLQVLIQEKLDAKGIEFALVRTELQPESQGVAAG